MAPTDNSKKGNKIKVLIVDDIPEARESLKKLLAFEPDIEVVGTAGTGLEGLELAKQLVPNIVLMDINMPDMDGITATKELRKAVPTVGVIMMSVQGEAEYIRRAMSAGARDFLTKPPPAEELYATVRNVYETIRDIRTVGITDLGSDSGKSKGIDKTQSRDTHVIVVYSPQGGAGKTTIATNIATGLMREGTKVLLIDCDFQFGDVGVFLDLRAQTTIIDLINDLDSLDMDMVDSVLVTHDSGLRALLAPARPEEAELVTGAKLKTMIEKLNGAFDFIILDMPTRVDEHALEIFDVAERILLVITPTLPSIKNTVIVMNLLDQLGYPEEKTQIIINRVNPELEKAKITFPVAAIEQKFKRRSLGIIPLDERRVLSGVNRGIAVVTKDRNLSPAKDFIALADALRANVAPQETPQEATPEPTKSSLFGRLRK